MYENATATDKAIIAINFFIGLLFLIPKLHWKAQGGKKSCAKVVRKLCEVSARQTEFCPVNALLSN